MYTAHETLSSLFHVELLRQGWFMLYSAARQVQMLRGHGEARFEVLATVIDVCCLP